MIRVRIKRKKNGNISSFQMSGHAEFAEYGQDIVCAGASAVSFGTVNAIMQVAGVEPEIRQSERGLLECKIPSHLSEEQATKVQILLEGMVVSLETIEREYGEFIHITFE
ncbi:ribosomal-processing cysteine protease Prp [Weizmannia coagulans]|jgi:uncharacterized protein YsxB (DUF464 family)|uniref:Ribosomal processing cysteine protease Prp n=3 Tax=Heyndrickxia TaxID=2837504 RepID=G2TLZ2_HEYCO|nr:MULTISPECIES: ribosomal-processing cysteine protease Prp [Heyndrickxia]AEP01826.1 protein of unknown function DUF464 [Heyndrickxia coagulans 36D1]AJO22426.1 hypothetical protein SB48_HM08orf02580 [Heyndrickxia coagulans]AKN56045.1 putative ribosomal protein [Heyndrickxia coagulans]ATW82749.1 ribosomal-processing cysteine protease Prp [Heyndrickxia coagulans]AWP37459.1 ribosomal-processing cysteine protease Prp [Heyndrickxia coagulans]